jgi:hypothetical protein
MGYFPSSPTGKMLCSMTADTDGRIHFPMPEYVRLMTPRQRAKWMRDNNVAPVVQGGAYSMFEMMQPFAVSPAGSTFTAVTTPASKTALSTDLLNTLPANIFSFVGKRLWCHYVGIISMAATTGTFLFTLNWGGSGGTVLATTGAISGYAVTSTNTLWYADFWIVARAVIVAGITSTTGLTLHTHGQVQSPSWLNTTTQSTNATQLQYAPPNSATPGTALADVTGLNQTIAQALTLSVTPSLTTASTALVDSWIVAMN